MEASAKTVLVVEDEFSIRLFVADYLRDAGFRVLEAADADDAIHFLKLEVRPVSVVFSDVRLPGGMDGLELARWVRSYSPDTHVILTSGYVGAAAGAMEPYRIKDLLPKPYSNLKLLRRIRSVLEEDHTG
jgi:CheY-like chemotaxis protein